MSNVKYDRIMADNKHYKAEKVGGFWQFIQKFPPTGYVGKHRVVDIAQLHTDHNQVYMGCRSCIGTLEAKTSLAVHI